MEAYTRDPPSDDEDNTNTDDDVTVADTPWEVVPPTKMRQLEYAQLPFITDLTIVRKKRQAQIDKNTTWGYEGKQSQEAA
eukprot:jgi/Psemu1/57340/gm1.57340_g